MARPKALDLFCCAGGAGAGLHAAGFDVVGVDIRPRPHYPYRFVLGDALDLPALGIDIHDFDFVWASPPCQRYSVSTKARADYVADDYPDLIDPVRRMLAGHRWTAIENVPSAPLRVDLVLTGPMVGLPRIQRRRHFELSYFVLQPTVQHVPRSEFRAGRAITVTQSLCASSHFYPRKAAGLPGRVPVAEACAAMGIAHKMTGSEVGEAIPPAYAAWIGRAALEQMGRAGA